MILGHHPALDAVTPPLLPPQYQPWQEVEGREYHRATRDKLPSFHAEFYCDGEWHGRFWTAHLQPIGKP